MIHSAAQLNLTVSLRNLGEHSNLTNVEFDHPFGMSFRKVTIVKSHRNDPIACDDTVTRGGFAMTNCRISHPIFREKSKVVFILTLDISNTNNWSHSIQVNVTASSKNEDPDTLKNNRATLQIPIIHRVNVLVRRWDSTKIVNISLSSQEMKEAVHRFQVENLSMRPMPVNVTFTTTKQLGHGLLWNVSGVTVEKAPTDRVHCVVLGEVEGRTATKVKGTREGCDTDSRLAMHCLVDQLLYNTPLTFALRGYVILTNISKIKTCRLLTVAKVSFDERRYTQAGGEKDKEGFLASEVTTDVEIIQEVNYVPFITGGAVGGLLLLVLIGVILWKAGFFKRAYKDRIDEDQTAVEADPQCTTPLNCDPGSA
ncbi:integrin alpha-D-like [Scyliorhinus torazame]|uniref:integrin alpha-D-like n=1 Tax=Scyliorhinus torazame TaxID=75743 RepID=UPI003B5B7C87